MNKALAQFHSYYDTRLLPYQAYRRDSGGVVRLRKHITTEERTLNYRFYLHAHPYVGQLVKKLIQGSVAGLEDADTEYVSDNKGGFVLLNNPDGTTKPRPQLYEELFTAGSYAPSSLVQQPYPVKDLDFTSSGAYSAYNWELFYHVPITVAIHLSQNQRYEEAQRWFHYIFDPTDDSDGPTPERFWKVKPFQYTDVRLIEDILVNLSTGADPVLYQDTVNSIGDWKDNPFRPFVVARHRQTAFMFKAVTAYLDNVIAWGDNLFSQYTGETINEAAQLYILAANILGPRPQAVPKKGSVSPQTYSTLRQNLDQFGNALVNFETDIPFDLAPVPKAASDSAPLKTLGSIGKALYFCVPRNDKLLQYWDTVADRLFKIHNSLNIQGIFQRVPLFEPPIDPALLARAAAAGLDVGAIVSGLNQPLSLVRFQYLAQKATEICQEVKSLGSNLLSAMEKQDNEALAILRAQHETTILKLAETLKYSAWQEAIKNREGVDQSIANATARYTYYQMLLGKKQGEITIPTMDPPDTDGLANMKFTGKEPSVAVQDVPIDIVQDTQGIAGGRIISSHELQELNDLEQARGLQDASGALELVASELSLIPQFDANAEPMGVGASVGFGGVQLSKMTSMIASATRLSADQLSYQASKATKIGGYARREQDWTYQSNLAAGELTQLFKQLRASQIREAIAERDWKNHQTQIAQAQKIEEFLTDDAKGKTTSQAFYTWMKREVKGLYSRCFQFAFDVARKAERALQVELGDPNLSYIQFGYLAGKEGLLAGEKLYQDIKRMELAYAELNRREYELTKHVSLLQLNPAALLQLRTTGRCTIEIPEELFDLDCPGHYLRRIKSVAVSIPCVVGPYTSVNCRLTLLKSSIRTSTLPGDNGYQRDGADDVRFSDFFGSVQSIVTSTGQADSGMFETNLRDDRKLPFEWLGAVGQWQLDLPSDVRQFDFDTIADVIFHLRYTAREGGDTLRSNAVTNLESAIAAAQTSGSVRLFSLRHEFPTEWAKFTSVKLGDATALAPFTLTLKPEHYPFWSQARGRLGALRRVDLYAESAKDIQINDKADGSGNKDALVKNASLGGLRSGNLTKIPLPAPTGQWTLFFDNNSMTDMWLALTWGAAG